MQKLSFSNLVNGMPYKHKYIYDKGKVKLTNKFPSEHKFPLSDNNISRLLIVVLYMAICRGKTGGKTAKVYM